ncbi:TPA: porin [Pasteurella multocida]|nr:porin [Pasteurella multocida]
MKKTIVALAVAAVAATSANAATVYNQDGTKVDVNGSVRLLLKKEKDKRGDLMDNGSRVSFKASHDLGEGLSALAYAELRFSKDVKNIGNNVHAKRLYAGFAYEGVGTLTFGNQLTIGDDVGVSDYTYFLGGINNLLSSGEKAINFKSAKFNGLTFGGAYVFSDDKNGLRDGRGFVVAGLYNRKIGDVGFAFEAGYSQKYVKQKVASVLPALPGSVTVYKDKKEKAFMVGAELSYAGLALGVDYAQSSKVTNVDGKKRALEVGLNYDINDKAKVYTDFIWAKEGPKGATTRDRSIILGAGYKLHKQVETFVEGRGRKKYANGVTTKDNVVGVGLRVHF